MSNVLLKASQLKKYFSIDRANGNYFKQKEKAYIKAVDDVEFTVSEGETVAIVGESGSGKTTLSRLMLMLDSPDSGELFFKDSNVEGFSKKERLSFKKSIQPVFQNPVAALNPRMRIKDILVEPLLFLSQVFNANGDKATVTKKDLTEKVREVLQKVGLQPDDAQKFPHQFSGGQRQRIAIARALISEPELIILDEPVASQDISIQAQILNLLKDLQEKEHLSFVFIAHDLATVKFLSDKIYVMYFGKVVESGTTDELFSNPLHPYTQNLLASHLPSHPDNRDAFFNDDLFDNGEVPSPLDPPPGCNFQSRCPFKQPVCEQEQTLQTIGNQQVACVRFSEI
ncbi:MAG: ABC transporter ATP-binding protein [Cellvibrionaceae bacterium]